MLIQLTHPASPGTPNLCAGPGVSGSPATRSEGHVPTRFSAQQQSLLARPNHGTTPLPTPFTTDTRIGTIVPMTETFTRPISGREIEFKLPTDAQLLVLGRLLRITEKIGEDTAKIAGSVHQLSKVLDIIDSMVIEQEDRDWLEERILDGTADLTEIMSTFRAEAEEAPNRATERAAAKKTGTARARKR